MDCWVCSIWSCSYSMLLAALDYPFFVFFLSVFMAVIIILNVHTSRIICQLNNNRNKNKNSVKGDAVTVTNAQNFDYGPTRGPHTWLCNRANQSPINIVENDVQRFPIRELLNWNHYDDMPTSILIENTGNTVILRATYDGNVPTLSSADLFASYTFVEICFRWSLLNNEGSEHMLNYKKFPLEMQVMHRTGPQSDSVSSYDLLMVAYFFEISSWNPFLDPLTQNLPRITTPNTRVEVAPFPVSYLCYPFRTNFYSYGGSLTEPPCYQGAEWFIFPEPLAISELQMNEFRNLLSSTGTTRILRNARPVQRIDPNRIVNLNHFEPLEPSNITLPTESDEQCEEEESNYD